MNIKEIRKELGWSKEKMASEIGVSFWTLEKWEMGYHKPSRLAQEKIDAIIKKHFDEFLKSKNGQP